MGELASTASHLTNIDEVGPFDSLFRDLDGLVVGRESDRRRAVGLRRRPLPPASVGRDDEVAVSGDSPVTMCERETVGPGLQNRHHWSQDRTTEIPRHYEYWIRPIARRAHAATSRPRGNQKTNRRNKSHEKWRAWMRQSTTTVWPISRTSRAKNRCELHEVPPRRHQAGARSEMTMVGRRVAAMIVALGASMATGSWSGAQSAPAPRSSFPVGTVVPKVTSPSDSSQHYALYLPAHYDATQRWPALLLLDPRGRALVAMQRFQAAAERDGYIVLSSYNTVSDSTEEPNVHALNAMLSDLQNNFSTDTRRMYLAGFSGTARLAWAYAYELPGHVPGVLGFAAGLPWRGVEAYARLKQPASFVYFGAAGTGDFNYDEIRALGQTLDSVTTIPHRLEYFEGPHSWPPPDICGDAVDWMELQAMTHGLRPRNDPLVAAWITHRLALALAAEDSGDAYQAYLRYRDVRDDFRGLHDVTFAISRVVALKQLPAVRDRRKRELDLQAAFENYSNDKFRPYYLALHDSKHPPALGSALHDLDIAELQRQQRDSVRDRLGAQAARRMLALVSVNTAFYIPRQNFTAHDPAGALAVLAIAHEIQPASSYVCFEQAKAYAELGQTANAVGSLQCAKAGGTLTAVDLRDEHAFDRIRSDPTFTSLAATLPATNPPDGDD